MHLCHQNQFLGWGCQGISRVVPVQSSGQQMKVFALDVHKLFSLNSVFPAQFFWTSDSWFIWYLWNLANYLILILEVKNQNLRTPPNSHPRSYSRSWLYVYCVLTNSTAVIFLEKGTLFKNVLPSWLFYINIIIYEREAVFSGQLPNV